MRAVDISNASDIPADLAQALEAQPSARKAFEAADESYRRGFIALLREARDDEHRANRLELVVKTLQRLS
jgi:uncharacterized protein YdeI (YjbR/CyaY-like superfamily)